MVTRALWLVAIVACQGGGGGSSGGGVASGSAPPIGIDATAGFGSAEPIDAAAIAEDARARIDEPDPLPDPGKQIAELGAIAAWQAVIDRAQLLARRNQHGVVYGRIGPPILMPGPAPEPGDGGVPPDAGMVASPYVWLVDDTEGNGALGIRVALGRHAAKQGDRVALGGAWLLDEARRWYWAADAIQPIAVPATPSELKDPPAAVPGHDIVTAGLPSGARTISVAHDGDAVYFQLVGPMPVRDGDGWAVANELGDVPFAMMTLPGERASYGGQDMRAPDERWQLKRAQTYWVRIGKIRGRGPGKPVSVTARTAPVRVN
jgi:hypothetical protein